MERLENRRVPATHVWTGASTTSSNWSDTGNWSGGAPSAAEAGAALIFPTAARTVNFNDIAGLTIGSIQFTSSGYLLAGMPVTLSGNTSITAATGANSIALPLSQQPVFVGPTAFFNHVYDVAGGATLAVIGQITGTPLLNLVRKTGAGDLILSNSANDYGGSTLVDTGKMALGVDNAVPPNPCIVAAGATLDLAGHSATIGSLSGSGSVLYPASPVFGTLTTGVDDSSTTFDGVVSGNLNLVKAGTGTFSLSGVSSFGGQIVVQAGALAVVTDNAVPPNPCFVAAGAILDLAGHNLTLGSLSGAGTVLSSLDPVLTIGADNSSTTFGGVISGPVDLIKTGTGTLTLSGASTYGGQTTVLGGTLEVTGSLPAGTVISVSPGAMLSGTATVASVSINGTPGDDAFAIDATAVTLNGTPIIAVPWAILTVNGLDGNDTFDVRGTRAGSAAALVAGIGSNTFNIGSPANTLDAILGPVNIEGLGGTSVLTVNDQGAAASQNWDVAAAFINRYLVGTPRPSVPRLTYHNVAVVTVNAGTRRDFIGVQGTAAGTTTVVNGGGGGGADSVTVKDVAGTLNAFQGPLQIHDVDAYNLFLLDQLNPASHRFTVNTGEVRRDGIQPITFDPRGQLTLATGTGTDVVNVQSFGGNVIAFLVVGTGDMVTVGSLAPALGGTMTGVTGDLRIQAVAGQTPRVILDDSGNTSTAPRGVQLGSDPLFGYLVSGLANGSVGRGRIGLLLDAAAPVTIRTGAANDGFRVRNLSGVPTLSLDAGGGANSLDYSALATDVAVNLQTGQATGLTAGVANIRNVAGGSGNDFLIGDAQDNLLTGDGGADLLIGLDGNDALDGGEGNDVLIGGLGADVLSGGNGEDVLIGGYTVWDTQVTNGVVVHAFDLPALNAVWQEWADPNKDFQTRYADLRDGVGVNGVYVLNKSTAKDDDAADTLTGAAGADWFLVSKTDQDVTDATVDDKATKI